MKKKAQIFFSVPGLPLTSMLNIDNKTCNLNFSVTSDCSDNSRERSSPSNSSAEPRSRFYFLFTYGVCKKRKYCNRMNEKKTLFLMDVHVLYVLEDKISKKHFRMSVWLNVRGSWLWTQ